MNTISSTISIEEPSSLKRVKIKNQRLVKILNHKMFKGYREIQKAKQFYSEKPKYIGNVYWENRIIDPFEDDYNLEYKRKNLSLFYQKDLTDMIQIKNCSKKDDLNKKNILKNTKSDKNFENYRNRNNFRKKQNINLFIKQKSFNNNYFYFSPNSLLIRNDLDKNNKQKKNKLFKTIFSGDNEKGLYNDIPIFAIQKNHKKYDNKKREFIYLPSKEERTQDLQYLYNVSHKLPIKKVDFTIRYNIKSAKQRNKKNNFMERAIITSLPHKIPSAKPYKNRLTLNKNKSDFFMTTVKQINNNYNRIIKKKYIDKNEIDITNFHNSIIRRAQSSRQYRSRNIRLVKNYSDTFFDFNNDFGFSKDNSKEITPKPNYFHSINRFVNDQIVLNYIKYKKSQFKKLQKLIEY